MNGWKRERPCSRIFAASVLWIFCRLRPWEGYRWPALCRPSWTGVPLPPGSAESSNYSKAVAAFLLRVIQQEWWPRPECFAGGGYPASQVPAGGTHPRKRPKQSSGAHGTGGITNNPFAIQEHVEIMPPSGGFAVGEGVIDTICVPEPATLGLGAAGILARRRSKK